MTEPLPDRPALEDLGGLWTRTRLVTALGAHDIATEVRWLQGVSLFGDIRQPRDAPDFSRVRCLRDLRDDHMRWMAEQEAFAGRLVEHDDHFEWDRAIDFQPPGSCRDRGRLAWVGETLVETGYEIPYIEHWRRTGEHRQGAAALLRGREGRAGVIVRVDETLVFAKGRPGPLAPVAHLRDALGAATSLAARQDLFDCEIAFAALSADGWRIEKSTWPFRIGLPFTPLRIGTKLSIADLTSEGEPFEAIWTIESVEGDLGSLVEASPPGVRPAHP